MLLILINMVQHEQYYLIILLIGLKASTLLTKTLAPMLFCKFSKISRDNLFVEHIWATPFGLSFVNPRKNSEGTDLVKFLQSFHFNIKCRKD